MTDEQELKQELIQELDILRQRVTDLEQSELAYKRAEEELRESKKILEDIVEGISDGVFFLSQDFKVIWANKATLKQTGYSIEEMKGRYCYSVTHNREKPCQPPNDTCPVEEAMKTGNSITVSHTHVNKVGDKVFTEVSAYPIRNNKGEIVRFVHFSRDITERRQAEEALYRSEEEATQLARENALVAEIGQIISSTPNMEEVYALFSAKVKILLPYDRIVINLLSKDGTTLINRYVEGDFAPERNAGDNFPMTRTLTEATIQNRAGAMIDSQDEDEIAEKYPGLLPEFKAGFRSFLSVPLISRDKPIGGLHFRSKTFRFYSGKDLKLAESIANQIAGAVANSQLFNERKQIEEALGKSEERFRDLYDHAPVSYHEFDMEGRITRVNRTELELLGYTQEEMIGQPIWKFNAEEEPSRKRVLAKLSGEIPISKGHELIYRRKNGTTFPLLVEDRLILDPEGRVVGIRSIIIDITERKKAEETLKKSEIKYRKLHESMMDGFVSVSMDGMIEEFNESYRKMLGYTPEELIKLTYRDLTPEKWHSFEQSIVEQQILMLGYSEVYEKEYRKKNGTVFPVEIRAFLIKDETNSNNGVWAIARDITERKRVEEALQKSEEQAKQLARENSIMAEIGRIISSTLNIEEVYQSFTEKVRELIQFDIIAIGLINADKNMMSFPYTEGLFIPGREPGDVGPLVGSTAEKMLQTHAGMIIAMEREEEIAASVPALMPDFRCGIRSALTVPLISGDRMIGTLALRSIIPGIYTEGDLLLVQSIGNQIAGAIANAQLYGRLKETEESLRRSEGKFRDLFDSAPVGYHEVDMEGRIANVNRTDQEMLGYNREELIGEYVWKFNVEEDIAHRELLEKLAGFRPPGHSFERTYLRKDGTTLPVLLQDRLNKDNEGKITGIRVAIQDITEQKRTGDALQESEERYRQLVEVSPEAIFVHVDGKVVYINPTATKLFKLPDPEKSIGKSVFDFCHQDCHDLIRQRIQRMQESGKPVEPVELKYVRSDGQIIDVEVTGAPVTYNGKWGILTVARDISDRKQANEALLKSEERFKDLFDHAPMGYYELDSKGLFTNLNQTELEMMGYSFEEMIGQPVWKFNEDEEAARKRALAKLAGVAPMEKGLEVNYRRKDGTVFPVLIEDQLLKNSAEEIIGIRGTIQDVTDQTKTAQEVGLLQEQLYQAQRMESIGRLAGGIAHDFNNLLTVIRGYSQLSLSELKKGDPLRENIEEIRQAGDRAQSLTRQLLAFSRRQILEFKTLDLNQLTQGIEKMLRRMIGEDIELMIYSGGDLGSIRTDPGQMEQVIMNLAVNARDAMPSGGKLILEMDNIYLDEEYARNHVSVKPGHYVRLSVSDTGCGMTPEVKSRVFEPFFTTKGKEKGTGLGLSTVYGIVKQSEGNIWVYSEPGKGTTFKIYLPRVDEPAAELEEKQELEAIPRGDETVLVVEDEEAVRRLAVQILKKQGYKVLESPNSGEALLVCEQHQEPIDLIVTDVVMPRMSGPEFIERLRQIRQEFKTLYMSGYTDEAVVHHGVREGEMNFIQKPFTLEGLARKVREVLDKA